MKKVLNILALVLLMFSMVVPNFNGTVYADNGVCSKQNLVALINGDFETPDMAAKKGVLVSQDEVPGWKTTDPTGEIEVWKTGFMGIDSAQGKQHAELNAHNPGMLYQDVKTTPGQKIYWGLSHRGRDGVDTMRLRIGAASENPLETPTVQQISDNNKQWARYEGIYIVPEGQTMTRFGFEAVSSASDVKSAGNFLDNIFLGTEPCITAKNSVDKDGMVQSGDILTYQVTIRNDGGDIAADSVFTDKIPDGTEYVPESIKLMRNGTEINITDKKDSDIGHIKNDEVTVNLGDILNFNYVPEGFTVQFKVKATSKNMGKHIKNKAQVQYRNLLSQTQKTTETNAVVNEVVLLVDKPEINSINDTDKQITGTGTSGDEIIVRNPDGKEIGKTTVGKNGKWKLDVPEETKLIKGDKIAATAKKTGTDKESDSVRTVVTGKEKVEDKSEIDSINDTDNEITGTTPGDEVIIRNPDGKWKLDVPEGTKLIQDDKIVDTTKKTGADKEIHVKRENSTGESMLPKTGEESTFIMQVLGGVFVLIALLITVSKRKKYN
ncbi:Ig-like domain-containing protein [Bacillus toyonensis]|uniref:Ig-like domain-containing protein n=1 Tax=Bacillus toyonensis TaxID=155322 RepID=UPI003D1C3D86